MRVVFVLCTLLMLFCKTDFCIQCAATENIAIEAQLAHTIEKDRREELERGMERLMECMAMARRRKQMAELKAEADRATITVDKLEHEIRVAQAGAKLLLSGQHRHVIAVQCKLARVKRTQASTFKLLKQITSQHTAQEELTNRS